MNRLTYWYSGLSRKAKIAITVGGIAVAVIVAVAILYMVFKPTMVEVTYGTIVYDPVDGHVWENNTQTIWVEASEAGNYKVERIEKISEENQARIDAEKQRLEEEAEMQANATGLEPVTSTVPTDVMDDLRTLQNNLGVTGQDVITGLETAKMISDTKAALIEQRNLIANTPTAPEAESYKQQILSIYDMGIQICDLWLKGIETGQRSYFDEANALIRQAEDAVRNLIPTY